MFSLVLENKNGAQLTFGMGSPYTITEIQGLNPPDATINTSQVALLDGANYNSAKVNMRQLNIAFAIEYSAAQNRVNIYNVLKTKQWVRMYYTGDQRDVYIDGYIQNIDITYFEMKQIVTVTILCPKPYFKAAQEIINEMSSLVNSFHFPFPTADMFLNEPKFILGYLDAHSGFTIENDGDVDCGMIIELYARNNTVVNPKIFNYITGEFFGLNFSMQTGDVITINTNKGDRSVTLLRNGAESNLFNYVMANSTWLQLEANGSTFVYEFGAEGQYVLQQSLLVTITHSNLYEGV